MRRNGNRLAWMFVLGWIASGLALRPAAAEPPPAQGDLQAEARHLHEVLLTLGEEPTQIGHDGALHAAWKTALKSRASKVHRPLRDLAKDKVWYMAGTPPRALRLKEKEWSRAVRTLATGYVALGTAHKHYGKVRVSPKRAYALWDKRNPEPDLTGLTPAGRAIVGVRADIQWYERQGRAVPYSLRAELARLIELERLEIAEREARHRAWKRGRVVAFRAIDADVEQTRLALRGEQERMRALQGAMREFMANMQRAEEQRLAALCAPYLGDPAFQEDFQKLAREMELGRQKAQRYDDIGKSSKYGSLIRQGWTVHRTKLLSRFTRAVREAKKAAEEQAAAEAREKAAAEGAATPKAPDGPKAPDAPKGDG